MENDDLEKTKQLMEAKAVVNRQQYVVQALGVLEEMKLLLSNLLSNSPVTQNLEFRKQVFASVFQTLRRYNDALAEAKKEVCTGCKGSGIVTGWQGERRDCWDCGRTGLRQNY